VFGAFKHHVLEEVGEAGAACTLIERTDVVPEIDCDERQAMVFVSEDDEAVGEGVLIVFELGELQRLGGRQIVCGHRHRRGCETACEHCCCDFLECELGCFHLFSTEARPGL
jgi:hypothetical protein